MFLFEVKSSCIVFLLCLVIFSSFSSAQRGCQRLTINELGNTTAPSDRGFISDLTSGGDGGAPSVQVFAMSVVCEAVASQRGEFLYTSVVANFTASNRPSEDFVIGQFEFACQTNSWGTSLFNAPSLIIPSDATLDTPSRSDCRLCGRTSDPSSLLAPLIDAGISAGNYDNVTHCLLCVGCIGLNQCTGDNLASTECCNHYLDDSCVSECPANVSVLNGTVNECFCNPGLTGSMCEMDIDECTAGPNPCFNGGDCNNTIGSFVCNCAPEFMGNLCEDDVNECDLGIDNCTDGSRTCSNIVGGYDCICLPGFTGRFCEVDVNECTNDVAPCMNGGTCNNTLGSFECMCPPTYTGLMCEVDIDECSPVNPCENNGTCMNTFGGFNCNCTTSFEGAICEDDIDECSVDPCENNGTCINTFGGFNCNCTTSFEGARCENDIDECAENPCGIGGQCSNTFGSFVCNCSSGFDGDLCGNINECASAVSACMNSGVCSDTIGSFNCSCTPGFTGRVCEADVNECTVLSNACPSGTNCVNTIGSFMCDPIIIITAAPTASPGGISLGIIIAIIVGGVVVAIIVLLLFLFCCYCCRRSKNDDYAVQPTNNIIVRTWDPRTQHDNSGSLRGSLRSTGRGSFARSSISSVGSFLRASLRRLSGKRRSGRKTGNNLMPDEDVTMKVTPL